MVKNIFLSYSLGTAYWLEADMLMFAPLDINDGLIDFNHGGAVEFENINGEKIEVGGEKGKPDLTTYLKGVIKVLQE